jgi:uncharacterized protein (TIGR02452 family)
MFREKLIGVYRDTETKCLTGKFSHLPVGKSTMYSGNETALCIFPLVPKYDTKISVINDLVLNVTERLVRNGDNNIMVLNLASCFKPGGGVKNGAVAQEEDLFRKTNYFQSLTSKFYPIPEKHVIFTDKVTVIKNDKFEDLDYPFDVSMIAAAAIKDPVLTRDGRYSSEDYKIVEKTIENIFKVSNYMGKETLVLGALGCGAYHNPPNIIISLFNKYLKIYDGCFKNIVFAVYSTRDDNFSLFSTKIHIK